jgi:outer membrane protein assembly factor BamB
MAMAVGTAACGADPASDEDWPRWRGPRGDGIVRLASPPQKLPAQATELWKATVGKGYSSPVASQGRVYLFHLVESRDVLTCYDAAKGTVLWEQSYEGGYTGSYAGTRASPVIDADRIYTYGGNGDLVARQLADGKQMWRINVLKDTSGKNQQWGTASNPLIDGDTFYVQGGLGGAAAVAVDKATGAYRWKSQARGGSYASPILVEVDKTRQLVCLANKAVHGMDAATGKTLWEQPWETEYDVNAATPIHRDGHVFITTDYQKGCMMLKVSATGATKLWQSDELQCRFQPPILDGDHLYANSEGLLKCITWPDGKLKWCARDGAMLGAGGSVVRFADKLLLLSERGKLTLGKATPEGWEKIGQLALIDGREVWATPLIHQGRLYARGPESLVCVQLDP